MPTNHPTIPRAPSPRRPLVVAVVVTASVACYILATYFAITDKPGDRITDALIDTLAIAAIGGLIVAAVLGVGYDLARRAHQNALYFEATLQTGVAVLRSDTGNIPRITETLDGLPTVPEIVSLVDDLAHQLRVIGERQKWLLRENGLLPPASVVVEESVPVEQLHEMTKEAFRLGRRSRTAND